MDPITIFMIVLCFVIPIVALFRMEKILQLMGIDTSEIIHFQTDEDRHRY